MAVASVFTVRLRDRQLACPADTKPTCHAPYCLHLGIISPPFGDIAIKRTGTLRTRGVSPSRKGFPIRAPVLSSQEASTSTLLVQEVEFTWKGPGSEVLLTGDFLNWETKLALEKRSSGVFSLKQTLASGRYLYKFIVDGEWKHSPDSPIVPDGTGGLNNEVIITANETTTKASQDLNNATQPLQANTMKDISLTKPAKETGSRVAVKKLGESTEQSPTAVPGKVVKDTLKVTMSENVIPLLRGALCKEAGITDLDVTFEDNQLKTSFSKEAIPYCFWVFFPDGVLEGSRGSSLTAHGSLPSTIEPFLVDEKKITPELLVFWIKKRLFAQKILSMN